VVAEVVAEAYLAIRRVRLVAEVEQQLNPYLPQVFLVLFP
jgi:hypothetical protein